MTASNLPTSDSELIKTTREEFENTRGKKDYPDAAFRYGWALVHSARREDVELGLHLLAELLDRAVQVGRQGGAVTGPSERELLYTIACGHFRLKAFVDSRRYLNALLEKFPESAQARNLMVDVEDAIIRDGLLTAGVATGAVVVGGLILGALLGGKRR